MAISVKITSCGITPGTSNSFYIVWALNAKASQKNHLDHYTVKWKYRFSSSGAWFDGGESNVDNRYTTATYTIPDRAYQVNAWVNAYAKKHSVKKGKKTKQEPYWTSKSTSHTYTVSAIDVPGEIGNIEPVVENGILKLSVTVPNSEISTGTDAVQFEIQQGKDGTTKRTQYYLHLCKIVLNQASNNGVTLSPEHFYVFRGRYFNSSSQKYGPWSEWSGRYYGFPGTPTISSLETASPTSTRISFTVKGLATSYTIEYQNINSDFDVVSEVSSQEVEETSTTTAEKTKTLYLSDLAQGEIYYFRVRAANNTGYSQWSSVESLIIGTEPAAPTTWSDITSAELGETVHLYWTHNSQDGSSMRKAQLRLSVNGTPVTQDPIEIDNQYLNTVNENKVQEYELALTSSNPLHSFSDADVVTWEVRTKGIFDGGDNNGYGDWSTTRTITVYQSPTVSFQTPSESVYTSYPLKFQIESGPVTQIPVSYHLTITANEDYIGIDSYGNEITIASGTEIYSGFFDTNQRSLTISLLPTDVIIEDGVSYTATILLYMNSGLSDDDSMVFTADIGMDPVYPEILDVVIDESDWSASVYAVCYANDEENDDTLASDTTLELYRIDSTGGYTYVDSTDNNGSSAIPDPHPALDFARYRILARNNVTGRVAYQDYFAWEVGCTSIVIQWDETWNAFEYLSMDDGEGVSYIEEADSGVRGAQLILPYNIDVSESYAPDAALIEYIGRNYPVSYYGTQRGQSATWNVEIPADDDETLFALRELADWMGDVYVREPSGTGYWANIAVSMSQKHKEVLIPVSLSIKRVEGGA